MTNSNTKTFTISHTNPDTGETFDGTFTSKRRSMKDVAKQGVRRTQLSGGYYCCRDEHGNPTGIGLDEETEYLNTMMAHLEVSIIQAPTWFNLDEMYDMDLIMKIYTEVVSHEASFFRSKNGTTNTGSGGSSQDSSGQKSTGEVVGNTPKKVVGKEVHASLEP